MDGAAPLTSQPDDGAAPLTSQPADGLAPSDGEGNAPAPGSEAGPYVNPCTTEVALVECNDDAGNGCECLSKGAAACPQCDLSAGARCRNLCGANEYVVVCGGPLVPPLADGGGAGFVYHNAPDGCLAVAGAASGPTYSCCTRVF
jgi:hypothetical protein